MNRRQVLIAAWAFAVIDSSVLAQKPVAIPRIGLLWIEAGSDSIALTAFRDGLRVQGYVDGRNIQIDTHSLVERYDLLAEAANRLVKQAVDVIVSYGATATRAASRATSTIPIVMLVGTDPVKLGVVAALAKPGGNVTGVTFVSPDLDGKRLEILKEIVPRMRRIGVLFNPESATEATGIIRWEAAAQTLNMEAQRVEIRFQSEIDRVISEAPRQRVEALAVVPSTMFAANRKQIVTAIAKVGLPAIYAYSTDTDAGGLMSYGPNVSEGFHRAAGYVDKILKGAKPADIPVEQPTKFELAVNLKTAKVLGITIPQSILLRADKVIE